MYSITHTSMHAQMMVIYTSCTYFWKNF